MEGKTCLTCKISCGTYKDVTKYTNNYLKNLKSTRIVMSSELGNEFLQFCDKMFHLIAKTCTRYSEDTGEADIIPLSYRGNTPRKLQPGGSGTHNATPLQLVREERSHEDLDSGGGKTEPPKE